MNYIDVVNYFRTIAEQHVALQHTETEKHFVRINIDEILGGLKTDLKFPLLILEAPDGFIYDAHSDNEQKGYNIAFTVIKKADKGDFNAQDIVLSDMEVIADDIIARLRKEHREYSAVGSISKSFDENTVRWNKIGPIFESCFGWRVTFQVTNHQSYAYDGTKWTS